MCGECNGVDISGGIVIAGGGNDSGICVETMVVVVTVGVAEVVTVVIMVM